MGTSAESQQSAGDGTAETSAGNGRGGRAAPDMVGVRYGYMQHVGEFSCPPKVDLGYGEAVVVQTDRGMELGETTLLNCLQRDNAVCAERIERYVSASGPESFRRKCGRVLRVATRDDLAEHEHLRAGTREKMDFCNRLIEKHNLPMKLVDCEHLFGGERIVFYFMAEGRIDFRALVKDLAHEYQTRIEMRQVGARDEARLVADYETCGQQCCCRVFLKTLKPVTMKMAKLQKATLDPSKVSGRCGRLKCCLRYEHTCYEDLEQSLPRLGERIETPEGAGVVVGRQVLTQLVQIAWEHGGRVTLPIEAIREGQADLSRAERRGATAGPPPKAKTDSARRRPEARDEPRAKPKGARSPDTQAAPKRSDESDAPAPSSGAADQADSSKGKRRRRPRRRRSRRKGRSSGKDGT